MPPIILYRIADPVAIAGVCAFVAYYTYLAPWWREAFGITLVIKDVLLGLLLALVALSLFWGLSRLTSEIIAWAELVLLMLIGPVLFWRTAVFAVMAAREGREWRPGRRRWLSWLAKHQAPHGGSSPAE